ncbi:hypothetical protein DFH09DRAFT_1086344 [Mycena vulgaris]|nr:hypothetical protein DFH09DRAFT_1086344 [Mycena vulgaris]
MEAKINNGNEERPVSVYRIQGIQCAVCFVVVEGRALQGAGWIDVLRYFKAITRRQAVLSILEAHSFGYIKRRVRVILVSQFSIEAAELAVFRISLFSFGSIFNLSWDNGIHPPFGIESESAPPAHSSNSTQEFIRQQHRRAHAGSPRSLIASIPDAFPMVSPAAPVSTGHSRCFYRQNAATTMDGAERAAVGATKRRASP